jgi:drug/metabolite transporter (DMT)-like permease
MSPLVVLILAVLATTYAGPIVRLAAAPALAIAFWRLTLVLPVTGVLAWHQGSGEWGVGPGGAGRKVPLPTPHSLSLMVLSGLLLAAHFWTWIASLRFTTVASSVVLVSLKPIFVWALAALWLHEHPSRREAWGIGIAVVGATLIGIGDARLSLGALGGDALALAGALTAAGYYVIGRRVRATVGVWTYATVVYAVAALALAAVALLRSVPLTGFAGRDWAVFAALAAGPMLVGHTGMNYALKHYRATTVNVAALGEPVGATLIAWLGLHESPTVLALIGGAVVVAGIGVTLMGSGEWGVVRDGENRRTGADRDAPLPTPHSPGGGRKGSDHAS